MQNKYTIARAISLSISVVFGILLLPPFHQAVAQIIICDPLVGICRDPYNGLLNQSNQIRQQSQSMESQQVQSNQATINRMKLQYGYAAYSSCTSNMLNVDKGNPSSVAIWLNYNEPCMENYKAKQEQAASTQCISLGNGRYSGNCTCSAGYTFKDSVCAPITCNAGYILRDSTCVLGSQFCTNKFGSNSVFNGKLCACAPGYKFNEFFDSRAQCVADAPEQTTQVPTVNQIIKNNPITPSASNGVSKVAIRVNNSTSTEATTTRPTTPQKGFFSRLLHALNPFSWF